MAHETPEQRARRQIDAQFVAAGWLVQDFKAVTMSLNESTVEAASLSLFRELGVRGDLSRVSLGHRVSGFNRLNSDCGPSSGRTMRNSPEGSSIL